MKHRTLAAGQSGQQQADKSNTLVNCRNGLEVPRQLQWANWHAGGEFNKVLVVKNVSTDVSLGMPSLLQLDVHVSTTQLS